MKRHDSFVPFVLALSLAALAVPVLAQSPPPGPMSQPGQAPPGVAPPPAEPQEVPSQITGIKPNNLTEPPEDAVRSSSGLVSKVLIAGNGERKPDPWDRVSVHFVGWTPAGAKFVNSVERGQPAIFDLAAIFPGFREGVMQMVRGEVRRLWVPEHLAPPNPSSGPRGAAVFDVELLGILEMPAPPEDLLKPPADADRLASGSFTRVLEEGEGTRKPGPSSKVLVVYTGWTTDGRVFDSSYWRYRPTLFLTETVMPAFSEALQLMVEGEKRRLWVPGNVAAGNWATSPQGDLVFDIHLMSVLE